MESRALPSLRPLRLGELLDQAIRLYRRNFLTFVGIIAIVYVPITILQTAVSALMSSSVFDFSAARPEDIFTSSGYWIGLISTFILFFVQIFLVQGIATGALARAVGDTYLGRKTGILDAYRRIGPAWVSLIGALLLLGLVAILVILWWVIVPCVGWVTGLGMLVFLGGAIGPMTAPSVVLEGQTALGGVQRAWSLARRRFWPLLGYVLVLYVFSLIIVQGPVTLANLVLTSAIPAFDNIGVYLTITTVIQALVGLLASLIYIPLQMTAFTLIYFDLRVRTEGFDIAMSAMQFDSGGENKLMPAPPSLGVEKLITAPDFGNFAILTLGAVALYILFFTVLMGGAFFFTSLF